MNIDEVFNIKKGYTVLNNVKNKSYFQSKKCNDK